MLLTSETIETKPKFEASYKYTFQDSKMWKDEGSNVRAIGVRTGGEVRLTLHNDDDNEKCQPITFILGSKKQGKGIQAKCSVLYGKEVQNTRQCKSIDDIKSFHWYILE
ncbi:hypothetical protein Pmani_024693 [Petrolisthes manimaculis]|uniref:Uncharacterized protein n=1 Tax=Petrolisthes manimaculis TaxID=1843537 RepID=A0AAE1P739_9EUCA|nr:hypothetical protein Pmani_024693 [Petrolisthes manimaculis]